MSVRQIDQNVIEIIRNLREDIDKLSQRLGGTRINDLRIGNWVFTPEADELVKMTNITTGVASFLRSGESNTVTDNVADTNTLNALTNKVVGDIAVLITGESYAWDGSTWVEIGSSGGGSTSGDVHEVVFFGHAVSAPVLSAWWPMPPLGRSIQILQVVIIWDSPATEIEIELLQYTGGTPTVLANLVTTSSDIEVRFNEFTIPTTESFEPIRASVVSIDGSTDYLTVVMRYLET